MWRNIVMVVMLITLFVTAANRLRGPQAAPDDDRPRAPDYVAGWLLPATPPPPAVATTASAPASAAPLPLPASPAQVNYQLDQLWARSDWDGVIALLEEQRRAPAPVLSMAVLREKLYAAEVNAGRTVLQLGQLERARQHFLKAQALDPGRPEAPDAMKVAEQAAAGAP